MLSLYKLAKKQLWGSAVYSARIISQFVIGTSAFNNAAFAAQHRTFRVYEKLFCYIKDLKYSRYLLTYLSTFDFYSSLGVIVFSDLDWN